MSEFAEPFTAALQAHRDGDLAAAETLYRRVLAEQPQHWDAAYLLGTLRLQCGGYAEAVEWLQRVAAARPDVPDAHNNLGVAFQALGHWEAAARSFEAALRAAPEYDQAWFNLGSLMQQRGLLADAEKCFRRALQLKPGDAALALTLADVLAALGQWPAAETLLRDLLARQAGHLDAQVRLGYVLARQERLDEAAEVYSRILGTCPDYHQVHSSLSYVRERQGRLDEAVASARRAVTLRPDYAEGYNNLGIALRSQHKLQEACAAFERAIDLAGDFPLAEFNLGTTRLLAGDFSRGWSGYARFPETLPRPLSPPPVPAWRGEVLSGGSLLVRADQGFGDTLQFVRFLPGVKQHCGARIVLACPPELHRLLAGAGGIDRLVADEAEASACDRYVPLSLLPALLQIDPQASPPPCPYLSAPAAPKPEIAEVLAQVPPGARTVGLVWQGNPQQARDIVRSCPLAKFAPLSTVPGIALVCLQTGAHGRRQMTKLDPPLPMFDVAPHLHDFAETAAVLARLDLVITVDTSVAHLAGALGRPCWTLLCHTPDWRWLLHRDDSPWYPTLRLFRQERWGEWDAVLCRVAEELAALVDRPRGPEA